MMYRSSHLRILFRQSGIEVVLPFRGDLESYHPNLEQSSRFIQQVVFARNSSIASKLNSTQIRDLSLELKPRQ